MKFYELKDDLEFPKRWHLKMPVCIEEKDEYAWEFNTGSKVCYYDKKHFKIDLQYEGEILDFTFAGFDIPIVQKRVGEIIQDICENDIQRIPIIVEGREFLNFDILNIISKVDCIDREKSQYTLWSEDDGREDIVGHYKEVYPLHIKPSLIPKNCHIFRIDKYESVIVVSEILKNKLENMDIKGITFQQLIV
jgi:hypothetical protein